MSSSLRATGAFLYLRGIEKDLWHEMSYPRNNLEPEAKNFITVHIGSGLPIWEFTRWLQGYLSLSFFQALKFVRDAKHYRAYKWTTLSASILTIYNSIHTMNL